MAKALPRNGEIADQLDLLADFSELLAEEPFKVIAYRRAATRIRESPLPIAELALDGKATELPGIGRTIETKTVEVVELGEMKALTKRRGLVPAGVVDFLRLPGVGPKTAARIWTELGVTTLAGLKTAAEEERLRALSGMGARSEEKILKALEAGVGVGDSMEDYLNDLDFSGKPNEKIPTLVGTLGYFNLHGVVDAVEWFGHRDPLKLSDAPEFPIALRPQDLHAALPGKEGGFPTLVFSEACYGAHVEGKPSDSSLALRFLDTGTLALVGSTCMSYGSIMGSLSAADLLAQAFWRYSQEGFPAGEALRLAKIEMIRKMDQEQGYLDGQDQKTLLSFNLFGDPLAQVLKNKKFRKSVARSSPAMEHFEIVCDRQPDSASIQAVPEKLLVQVRQIVSQYLPGMSEAHMAFVREQAACEGINHKCPTSQLVQHGENAHGHKGAGKIHRPAGASYSPPPARDLVTLGKQVKDAQGVHPYYAHLTLVHGKLVKLVVSR